MSRVRLLSVVLVAAGCAGSYPPTDPSAQELMARGEGPLPSIGDPPGAGNPGVVSGRLEAPPSFAPAKPIAFEPIALYRDSVLVAQTTSDAHGAFMFVGVNQAGPYEARVATDRLVGGARFSLRMGGHVSGLRLGVQPAIARH
jgi:hypothetical protein